MSHTLLCQLGLHTIILPEAFLCNPEQFTEVHAIGTNNERSDYDLLFEFFKEYPKVKFTLTILRDFSMVNSASMQALYEEALWRWYIDKMPQTNLPYVCLSGGVKTMVASFQKAAHLFGAEEVFHVLAEGANAPKNLTELGEKQASIEYVQMGREEGWPSLRELCTNTAFPLVYDHRATGGAYGYVADGLSLRQTIQGILERKRNSYNPEVYLFPFTSLGLLSRDHISWLHQPLQADDTDWLLKLPKTELHCHLGGFAAFGDLLTQVQQADPENSCHPTPILKPEKWPFPEQPISLDSYMRLGDNTGSKLFKNLKRLQKQIQLLYQHLIKQNVRYAEIRCSPDNYKTEHHSAWEILEIIQQTFQQQMDMAPEWCHVNLIVIATRINRGDLSPISRHLALAITAAQRITDEAKCRIVGVDLAGFEDPTTRASYFAQDFIGVQRCGLAITAHAGENDDAEGIWQAVHSLYARRIGHALHLYQAPDLIRTMADRRIAVEMCPYANLQIKGFSPMIKENNTPYETYPLLRYLEKGLLVTVNTDNIGISDASLTDNFSLLAKLCPSITRMQILIILRNGIEAAFVSPDFRNILVRTFDREVFQSFIG